MSVKVFSSARAMEANSSRDRENMSETKPPLDLLREFVIAGHGDIGRVTQILAQHPEILNEAYPWSENDKETAIQAAAQVGNVKVAEYLLNQGAPMDICTAAMLGRKDEVGKFLEEDPSSIRAKGAHGIPLLAHAALSGDVELVGMLVQQGAEEGMSFALHNAVSKGHHELVSWLLENVKPDPNWKNFQGKTALKVALEQKDEATAALLRGHGAKE